MQDRQIIYTTGALTRTVDESAALLDIMAGITQDKPHWAAPPLGTFLELSRQKPRPLRIRLTLDTPFGNAQDEVREAILRTARLLGGLGHHVEEAPYPQATIDEFIPIWALAMSKMPGMRWHLAQPITRWLREEGKNLKSADIQAQHRAIEQRLLAWFEGVDLWLTPTSVLLPPRVQEYSQQGDPKTAFLKYAVLGAFTAVCNVTGQPAISVPAGLSKNGLPIGAHLVGPLQSEALLLQVARQIEEAQPWKELIPNSSLLG
jgi:amidase